MLAGDSNITPVTMQSECYNARSYPIGATFQIKEKRGFWNVFDPR